MAKKTNAVIVGWGVSIFLDFWFQRYATVMKVVIKDGLMPPADHS